MSWPPPALPLRRVALDFGHHGETDTVANLSAAVRFGDALFLGGDESCAVERLTIRGDGAGDHAAFQIGHLLELADPEAEADIEGLAVCDGWLWVIGSHARTRRKPSKAEDDCIDLDELADLKDTRTRCLLARVPLVRHEDGWTPVREDGCRRAGLIRQTEHGSKLARALRKDPLIGPFTRAPAKEGGLDIEGVAVCGARVALGLRGPVVSNHAVLLELEIDAKKSGRLTLRDTPAKRLLDMEGLGIRDLKRRGDDLLILAGPTTSLSGPVALYVWRDWVHDPVQDRARVRLHRPERVLDLPFGRGCDHPEGLALWNDAGSELLVICDSPATARLSDDGRTIAADVYALPDF